MVRVSRCVALLTAGICADACVESHACTEIGCSESAGFTLHPPGDQWADGVYAMDVTFDAAAYACTFDIPDAIDSAIGPGVPIPVACTPKLDASLDAVVMCTTHSDGSSSSQVCTPIPGRYYLSVRTPTLAESLSVTVTLGGEPYFEDSLKLSYVVSQPNGPSCEPTCRNASADFHVPLE
jgi:hypothetical protein